MLADNLAGAASLHVLAGEYDRALALSDEALRVSQSIGNLWNQSYSLYMIDLVYMERGEMGAPFRWRRNVFDWPSGPASCRR